MYKTRISYLRAMKEIIQTDQAPSALGPYNQATASGPFVFTAGQIAINPATGELVKDSIEAETEQVLNNLSAILTAAGCTMEDVMSVSVYVTDMHDYSRINGVYAKFFPEATAPARALVEVRNLPKSVRVEISAIAVRPS